MVKTIRLSKLVTPQPSMGITGVVVPLAIAGGGLLGMYIIATRMFNLDFITELVKKVSPVYPAQQAVAETLGLPPPDPVLGQWGNMWNDAANFIGNLVGKIYVSLSHDSAPQGGKIGIAVAGLKPNTIFTYGWKELPQYNKTFTARSDGWWYGPTDITIASSTNPGTYHIFADQRPNGGGYGETTFKVTAGGS